MLVAEVQNLLAKKVASCARFRNAPLVRKRFPQVKHLDLLRLTQNAQLAGTFMVLFVRPQDAFQEGNPLLLTDKGEFVIKNLVLASAGLAVGSRLNRKSERVDDSSG